MRLFRRSLSSSLVVLTWVSSIPSNAGHNATVYSFDELESSDIAELEHLLSEWEGKRASRTVENGAFERARQALRVVRSDFEQLHSDQEDLQRLELLAHQTSAGGSRLDWMDKVGRATQMTKRQEQQLTCSERKVSGMDMWLGIFPVGVAVNMISVTFSSLIPDTGAAGWAAISVGCVRGVRLQGRLLQWTCDASAGVRAWLRMRFQRSFRQESSSFGISTVISMVVASLMLVVLCVIAAYTSIMIFCVVALVGLVCGAILIVFVLALMVAAIVGEAVFAVLLMILATPLALAFPVLSYLDVARIDHAILFCAWGVGFSSLLFVPYVVISLAPFLDLAIAWNGKRTLRDHAQLQTWHVPAGALEAAVSWAVVHMRMTIWLCVGVCDAAEDRNWLPLSISGSFLLTTVTSLGFATLSLIIAVAPGLIDRFPERALPSFLRGHTHLTLLLVFRFVVVLFEGVAPLVASLVVNTTCERVTEYTCYAALLACLHVLCFPLVIGCHLLPQGTRGCSAVGRQVAESSDGQSESDHAGVATEVMEMSKKNTLHAHTLRKSGVLEMSQVSASASSKRGKRAGLSKHGFRMMDPTLEESDGFCGMSPVLEDSQVTAWKTWRKRSQTLY